MAMAKGARRKAMSVQIDLRKNCIRLEAGNHPPASSKLTWETFVDR